MLLTWEPGNTRTPAILMTWEPGNTGTPDILNIWEPGNTGTVSPYTSGRKSLYGPSVSPFLEENPFLEERWTSRSILKSSLLSRTFAKESILGTCSWKNEHANLGEQCQNKHFS